MQVSSSPKGSAAHHLKGLPGEVGGVKVYLSSEVPAGVAKTFIEDNRQALTRFVRILLPLERVYDLPQSALHIFYDSAGGLIAFNRSASLFVNFRFYEAWRESTWSLVYLRVLIHFCR